MIPLFTKLIFDIHNVYVINNIKDQKKYDDKDQYNVSMYT